MSDRIRPYVPRPVAEWLRDDPDAVHRRFNGSLVFADISGFTTLTERLARRGKIGAEEMGDLLNTTFAQLLVPAYDYGAALIKWGGDAGLLLFDGEGHEARACRAASEMQQTMRRVGRLRTSSGAARLRMSIGIHSGELDFFLVGSQHRELVVTGPAATHTTLMEKHAGAGEVLVSRQTAAAIGAKFVGASVGEGLLLHSGPDAALSPQRVLDSTLVVDLPSALPLVVREHVAAGVVESEHRFVTTGFVQFQGADNLLQNAGPQELATALHTVIDAASMASIRHGVTFLGTDIDADGGKIILLAGAPRSHDRHEERMLCALREIMDTPTTLSLRAGASNGRVFAGDFGPHYRRTYSIVGDSVNLAARLMGHSEPGQFVATAQVIRRSRTRFQATPLPPFRVKGKSDPIDAVLVGPVIKSTASLQESAPLVGREEDVGLLVAALQAARGGLGKVVEISGEPGLGKSRLIEELRARAVTETVYAVSCDGFDASTPYHAWRLMLVEMIMLEPDADTSLAEVLRETVEARCPHLRPWLPLLAALLDVDLPMTSEVAALEENFRRPRLFRTVNELLVAILDRPTVIIFEDVHLMDDASAELLHSVYGAVVNRPWLLIASRRVLNTDTDSHSHEGVLTITLDPLDGDSALVLLEAATEASPLPPHELVALRDHAGGNPLFLLELLAARRRTGDLESLPDTLEGSLAAAIDDLPRGPRQILRIAAVLGTRFEPSLLDGMLAEGGLSCTAEDWLALDPFLTRDGAILGFRNALMREAAYEALPFRQRIAIHGWAGEAIESNLDVGSREQLSALSYHFVSAQHFDKAVRYSQMAGERALQNYANVEAALFFTRALQAARPSGRSNAEKLDLAEALGDVWFRLGELTKAERAFVEARQHAGADPVVRAHLGLRIAKVRTRAGHFSQALNWLSRGLKELANQDSSTAGEVMARLCAWYAKIRHEQGHQQDAVRWAKEAITRAEFVGARSVLAEAYQHLDRASMALGNYEHEAEVRQALVIWEELGDRTWQSAVLNHLGIRAYYQGDWTSALGFYAQARDLLQEIGDEWNAAIASSNMAEIYTDQGRLADAERVTRQALRVFRAADTPEMIAGSEALLARVASAEDRYDEAQALFASARAGFARAGEHAYLAEVDARALECRIRHAMDERAIDAVDALLTKATRDNTLAILPLLHRIRGWALAQVGDMEGARGWFEGSLRSAQKLGSQADRALAIDALVRVSAHRGGQRGAALSAERDTLFKRLGIVATEQMPLPLFVGSGVTA